MSALDQLGEATLDVDRKAGLTAAAVLAGGGLHGDAAHQPAHGLDQFGGGRLVAVGRAGVEQLGEPGDALAIVGDRGRVQAHDIGRGLVELGQFGRDLVALGLKGMDRCAQGLRIAHQAFDDHVNMSIEFAFDLAGAPVELRPAGRAGAGEALAFVEIGFQPHVEIGAVGEALAQAVERQALDIVEVEFPGRAARPGLAHGRALHARLAALVSAERRHAAAAGAAAQQAGQQAWGAPAVLRRHDVRPLGLARLRRRPGRCVDDPEVLGRLALHLVGRVRPRHALAGVRVFHHADPVPDDHAGI